VHRGRIGHGHAGVTRQGEAARGARTRGKCSRQD
jgi:hypothetical protein